MGETIQVGQYVMLEEPSKIPKHVATATERFRESLGPGPFEVIGIVGGTPERPAALRLRIQEQVVVLHACIFRRATWRESPRQL